MNSVIHKNSSLKAIFAGSLLWILAGCAQTPISPSGSNWHENDFVAQDVAAQLSNPADLTAGHGDPTVPAQAFVTAITSWSAAQPASSGTPSPSTSLGGTGGP